MGVVTLTDAWPKPGEPFTVSDLDRMPDDGHRYELLDGTLIVSPAPSPPHQRRHVVPRSRACLPRGPHRLSERRCSYRPA